MTAKIKNSGHKNEAGEKKARPSSERPGEQAEEQPDRPIWPDLVRFAGLVKPFMSFVWIIVLCVLISNALTLVMPLSIKVIIDTILPRSDMGMLNLLALGLVGFVLFSALFGALQQYTMSYVGERLVSSVRLRLHNHLQHQSISFIQDIQAGGIISRVVGDVNAVRDLLFGGFIQLLSNAARVVIVAGVLLYINWRLTLVSCVFLPFFVLTYVRFRKILRPAYKDIRHLWSRLSGNVAETFAGTAVVKTFGKEKNENLKFTGRIHVIMRKALRVRLIDIVFQWTAEIVSGLGGITLLWFGGHEVTNGRLTLGELMAFHAMLGMLFAPLTQLVMINNQVQRALASIERIFEILDTEPEIADADEAVALHDLKGEVVFENVNFWYEEDEAGDPKRVLEEISFTARPGETVALVGASGSGKTTIINLVSRFYDVPEGHGRITIDGVNIQKIKIRPYRAQTAIVGQENVLFRGNVRDNIAYGVRGATDEQIIDAARKANALEFVEEMDEGLDAKVGSGGYTLSGGQRQRMSIARAILTDPKILILDEATSALDSKSETLIQTALDHLMADRTCFVIAHRLSTIVGADKIIVLDKGRIVEQGTHEELLADPDGVYYGMFMEQFGHVIEHLETARALQKRDSGEIALSEREFAAANKSNITFEDDVVSETAMEAERLHNDRRLPAHSDSPSRSGRRRHAGASRRTPSGRYYAVGAAD